MPLEWECVGLLLRWQRKRCRNVCNVGGDVSHAPGL